MNPDSYTNNQQNTWNIKQESYWNLDDSMPLQQKNHNITHTMNSTIYKSIAKKNQHMKRIFNLKCMKMQQGQILGQTCLNFFSKQQRSTDKQNCGNESKGSNIQILKNQIKYLQQDDLANQKFPKRPSIFFGKNNSLNLDNHLNANSPSKIKFISGKTLNGNFNSTNKNLNLTLSRDRPATSQNNEAKKYFSLKKKSARQNVIQSTDCQAIIHNKNHNKFELIAPFRKYFQSKRNRQNRSCTIKIDEIYGKKLNKLVQFTVNEHY